ncbi:hypothetical protein JAAARDRAFT_192899 [Jaapia argillacea MUCL 33604]|uniref:Uncharacterized protein n=1 Tax=Jaapia argillacea MUCL 33604 TaxID=933084 RepID=A0A067PU85_9AGAM|nr:hypothetical protein JAAARDRAFT_192899 [Jaapia argillacea MUCL 33604]
MDEAASLHETFGGHSVAYYYEEIMQLSRTSKARRSTNRWNAFLSQEIQAYNNALPEGVPKKGSAALTAEISLCWKAMSKEEHEEATKDTLTQLQSQRNAKATSTHNTHISSFHDIRATLSSMEKVLKDLHSWTGLELALFTARPTADHFGYPWVFTSSSRMNQFFLACLGTNIMDVGIKFDAAMVSGMQGLAQTHNQKILALQSEASILILEKLRTIAGQQIPRMIYINFDTSITLPLKIIVENWPLSKFVCPSDIGSLNELNLLIHSWKTGATRFRKLTDDEHQAWTDDHLNLQTAPTNDSEDPSGLLGESSDEPRVTDDDSSATTMPRPTTNKLGSPGSHEPGPSPSPSQSTLTSRKCTSSEEQGRQKKKQQQGPPLADVVNTVSGAGGVGVELQKKTRKTRKDKGQKRGPRRTTLQSSSLSTAGPADAFMSTFAISIAPNAVV